MNVSLSQEIPGTEFEPRNEFIIGAFLSVKLKNNLEFQPEFYYLNKGVNTVELGDDESPEWKFSYIEVPVLLKYQFPVKGNIKPGIFAGPYVAFNLKATQIRTLNGITQEIDLDTLREKMDYGLVFGGSLDDVKVANTVIASHDIVAADSYAATLFNLTGADLPVVRAGAQMGLGTMDLNSINIEEINV